MRHVELAQGKSARGEEVEIHVYVVVGVKEGED